MGGWLFFPVRLLSFLFSPRGGDFPFSPSLPSDLLPEGLAVFFFWSQMLCSSLLLPLFPYSWSLDRMPVERLMCSPPLTSDGPRGTELFQVLQVFLPCPRRRDRRPRLAVDFFPFFPFSLDRWRLWEMEMASVVVSLSFWPGSDGTGLFPFFFFPPAWYKGN